MKRRRFQYYRLSVTATTTGARRPASASSSCSASPGPWSVTRVRRPSWVSRLGDTSAVTANLDLPRATARSRRRGRAATRRGSTTPALVARCGGVLVTVPHGHRHQGRKPRDAGHSRTIALVHRGRRHLPRGRRRRDVVRGRGSRSATTGFIIKWASDGQQVNKLSCQSNTSCIIRINPSSNC